MTNRKTFIALLSLVGVLGFSVSAMNARYLLNTLLIQQSFSPKNPNQTSGKAKDSMMLRKKYYISSKLAASLTAGPCLCF